MEGGDAVLQVQWCAAPFPKQVSSGITSISIRMSLNHYQQLSYSCRHIPLVTTSFVANPPVNLSTTACQQSSSFHQVWLLATGQGEQVELAAGLSHGKYRADKARSADV